MKPHIPAVRSVLDDPDALVPPAFWHCPEYDETIGPEVGELMQLFGYGPNPEQRILLEGNFGMDRNGRLTAFEVFILASRQNLKTGFLIQRAIGKALLLRRPLQVWTAHKESATDQAFAEFQRMRDSSAEFSKRIKAMPEGKGSKAIEFVNDTTIVFRPRTGKAGQSMSADDVDLDEYFAVEAKHEGSLIPTLSTRPNAQIGMASSAPHASSNLQRQMMARGRAAALGNAHEPRLLYAEWSPMRLIGQTLTGAPKYGPPSCGQPKCTHALGSDRCIADDREVIKLANPSAGRSTAPAITWNYIEGERRKLQGEAIDEYLKERLSIGVEEAEATGMTIFGPASVWLDTATTLVPDGVGAVGVAMSPDKAWISLSGASVVEVIETDGPEALETVEPTDVVIVAPILRTGDGAEAVREIRRLQDEHDCIVVLDENGPAATELLDMLEDEDVAVEAYTLRQFAGACSKFHRRLKLTPPTLRHLPNAELDAALSAAEWRWVSDNQVIARRDGSESLDTDMLEATVLAAKAAEHGNTYEATQTGVHE